MISTSYKSTLKTMILDLIPSYKEVYGWGEAPGDPDLEHALTVMSEGQAKRMWALCKTSNAPAVKEFIAELQNYQERR